ncbi:hypothetical protein MBANPS3_008554 [Mucor bainieri]
MDLGYFKLSNDSEKAIDSLAMLAESLGMDTVELSKTKQKEISYYTAVSKLTMDRMELQHESLKLDEMEYMLAESQKKADDELSLIKSMLLNLQQEPLEIAVQQQQIGEKEALSSEYNLLQKKYDDLGVHELRLTKIQELESKADTAEAQCKHQETRLESFTSLPSDMALASIKIQEAEDDLPTVSIGNVPQLASDLIIHTFKLERVGFLDDDSVMPVSGVREDTDAPGTTVPIEVYQSKDHRWTCIQQRSPTIKGKRQEYLDNMTRFSAQFQQVVLLTSMDASRRLDSQIQGEPFRVYGEHGLVMRAVTMGIPVLENFELESSQDSDNEHHVHLPGSGLAKHLYQQLDQKDVETTLLLMFALEGDNVQDGIEFARFINTLLKIQTTGLSQWSPPKSWKFLFGTPYNAELYQ